MRVVITSLVLVLVGCSGYPKITGLDGLKGKGIKDKRWCKESAYGEYTVAIYRQSNIWVWQPRDGFAYRLKEFNTPTGRRFTFLRDENLVLDDKGNTISYRDFNGVQEGLRTKPQVVYICEKA